jgi:hypothetical protein
MHAFAKVESTQQADIVGNWHLAALKGQVDMAVDDSNLREALVPSRRESTHAGAICGGEHACFRWGLATQA